MTTKTAINTARSGPLIVALVVGVSHDLGLVDVSGGGAARRYKYVDYCAPLGPQLSGTTVVPQ